MSFVDQEDVFEIIEKLFNNLFTKFSKKKIENSKCPRITYENAMLKYGTDKPDLRNPLEICDLTELFIRDDVNFEIFKNLVKKGSIVRAIVTKNTKNQPRSFFDNLDKWAKEQGWSGLAYLTIETNKDTLTAKGPIGKFFSNDALKDFMKISKSEVGDSVFFACGKKPEVEKILSQVRTKIARQLNLINDEKFSFCWIVDYPMYEIDEISQKIQI